MLPVIRTIVIEKHAGVDLLAQAAYSYHEQLNLGWAEVHFMIFCQTEKAIHLEQDIRKDFMEAYALAFPSNGNEFTHQSIAASYSVQLIVLTMHAPEKIRAIISTLGIFVFESEGLDLEV